MSIATTLSSLPLQVRVSLRDNYDSPNSSIQTALKSLNNLVGYDMTLEIAWVDLWNTLSAKYVEDKGTFVSTIAGAVETWLKRLEALLEGDEAFQEAFLEKMEGVRKALYVQIHEQSDPKTTLVRGELLTLFLPDSRASEYRSLTSRIGADIVPLFSDTVDAFVEVPSVLGVPSIDTTSGASYLPNQNKPRITSLPKIASLARPETLFQGLVPYQLIVRRTGGGIDIEGSHQPTLELIFEYFKRHSRKNLNDSRQIPYFKVDLVASFWGTGTLHDVVRIAKEDPRASWIHVEITPILSFIESICGYDLFKIDGGEWIYRRNEPFC